VGKASSNKKVARAARAGGRRSVRRQRGLIFPIAIAVVVVLGFVLIVYARRENQASAATPPIANQDHWHAAYGVYICDKFIAPFSKGTDPNAADPLGIHSHGDGVIHIHPFSSETSGKNATLGKYLDWEGVKLSTDQLVLPNNGGTYKSGETACPDGKKGTLKVAVWQDVQNSTGGPKIFVTDFNNIHFDRDGMGITIAFIPDDVDISTLKPPTAANLAALGGADSGSATTVPTTVPGETTVPGATTAPAATTTPASTTPAAPASSTG
jgi:hypothetical protein